MSIPEDVTLQLQLANKRAIDLESDLEVATELLDEKERTIRKLQMELSHAMGGALTGQLLEIKALKRMLCAIILKAGGRLVIKDLELEEVSAEAELQITENFADARTFLTVNNIPLSDRLRAFKERVKKNAYNARQYSTGIWLNKNSPLWP